MRGLDSWALKEMEEDTKETQREGVDTDCVEAAGSTNSKNDLVGKCSLWAPIGCLLLNCYHNGKLI